MPRSKAIDIIFCLLITLCVFLPRATYADDKPIELRPIIHAMQPLGHGNLTKYLINIYDAELWTDAQAWSFNEVFALTLHYHIDIEQSDLVEKSIKRMDALEPLPSSDTKNYTAQLNSLFPSIKNGDTITAVYFPNKSLDFYYNSTLTGSITDMVLAKKFLDIWFSPHTSEPKLRAELLNLSTSPESPP